MIFWKILFYHHENNLYFKTCFFCQVLMFSSNDLCRWKHYILFKFFCNTDQQLFEGMKAYRGVDGRIRIFRPNMNMNRMNLSAKRSGLPTFEGDEFIKCIQRLVSIDQEWVPHTQKASLYIRPTLIGIDVSGYEMNLVIYIFCSVDL